MGGKRPKASVNEHQQESPRDHRGAERCVQPWNHERRERVARIDGVEEISRNERYAQDERRQCADTESINEFVRKDIRDGECPDAKPQGEAANFFELQELLEWIENQLRRLHARRRLVI